MKISLKPRTTYIDGEGRQVHIAGPIKPRDDGLHADTFYSIGGDWFRVDGAIRTYIKETGAHPCVRDDFNEPFRRDLVSKAPDQSWWTDLVKTEAAQ